MAYYTKELIAKAKQIDLLTYLKNYDPDELVKFSRDTYTTKTHDSLKISNGLWYWFSEGIGGKSALEYLIKVNGLSFTQAMDILSNKNPEFVPSKQKKQDIKLIMPEKAESNDKAVKYLVKRGIDKEIIDECISKELIYQQLKYNNVVFVGYDFKGNPKYAMCRGTNQSRFMREAYGSHKAFSFRLDSDEKNNTLHIFESAIDLLSYATFLKRQGIEWNKRNLLSLAGVYMPSKNPENNRMPLSLALYLLQNRDINKIYLHLDNDDAGRGATKALTNLLSKRYEVIDQPPLVGKDFNDYLNYRLGKQMKEGNIFVK